VAVFVGSARLGQTIGPLGASALFAATSTFVALFVGTSLAVGLAVIFAVALSRRPSPVDAQMPESERVSSRSRPTQ
jgi:hypothetical protein